MKSMPLRTLLVALKKTIPAVLLLGSLSLAFAPKASAQILFSVDEFTTDTLTITLQPGSLLMTNVPADADTLWLTDSVATNTAWINASSNGTGGGTFGVLNQNNSIATTNAQGDFVKLSWFGGLNTVGNLTTGLSFTFDSPGLFSPGAVTSWQLTWGDPLHTHTVQSIGSATTGGGSAVPEPSSFAALLGCVAIGTVCRRRRRRV